MRACKSCANFLACPCVGRANLGKNQTSHNSHGILLQPRDTFRVRYKSSLQAQIHGGILHQLLLHRSSSTPIQLRPSLVGLLWAITITIHRLCIKLVTSNHCCIGPTLSLQPCAFSHRRLQRRYHTPSILSLSIVTASSATSVSAEPWLPHLKNSSYIATAVSPHQFLLNQARLPSDDPLNSRPSLVLHSPFTSPTDSNHGLPSLHQTLVILASTIFPSGSSCTRLHHHNHHSQGSPCVSSIFHDFTH
jgi:hypothetical protein